AADGLQNELRIAQEMMQAAGHTDPPDYEPIIGRPGMPPPLVQLPDGTTAISIGHVMNGMLPLSAYYTDRVRGAIDIAARVGALVAQGADDRDRDSQAERRADVGTDGKRGDAEQNDDPVGPD